MNEKTQQQVWELIKKLLKFPRQMISRHTVILELLQILADNNVTISDDLVRAVSLVDDDTALALLEKIG